MQDEVRSAGGIVLGDNGTIAMVRSENSQSWLFPKGRLDPGESDEQAARREIQEEAGLGDLELIDDLGEYSRPQIKNEKGNFGMKTIKMFLFAAPAGAALAPTMEILEAKWVNYREVPELLGSPHTDWFGPDRAWFASVFPRVREAIQRD